MKKSIRTLSIMYNNSIRNSEIRLFRGAVIESLGERANVLYHNHTGDNTFRYSYPLIQYKIINGKASITCIEEGADIIGQFLKETSEPLMLGDKEVLFELVKVLPEKVDVEISETPLIYSLHNWLPLNSKNYEDYKNAGNLSEKVQILERVLIGNILSFLKGVGIHLEEHLDIHITDITKQDVIKYKGVIMMSFDIKFKANITLPSYIGIGKNASMGYGVLIHK